MAKNRQGPKGPAPKEKPPIEPRKPRYTSKKRPSPAEAAKLRAIASGTQELDEQPGVLGTLGIPRRAVNPIQELGPRYLRPMVFSVANIVKLMVAVPVRLLWMTFLWLKEKLVSDNTVPLQISGLLTLSSGDRVDWEEQERTDGREAD